MGKITFQYKIRAIMVVGMVVGLTTIYAISAHHH